MFFVHAKMNAKRAFSNSLGCCDGLVRTQGLTGEVKFSGVVWTCFSFRSSSVSPCHEFWFYRKKVPALHHGSSATAHGHTWIFNMASCDCLRVLLFWLVIGFLILFIIVTFWSRSHWKSIQFYNASFLMQNATRWCHTKSQTNVESSKRTWCFS